MRYFAVLVTSAVMLTSLPAIAQTSPAKASGQSAESPLWEIHLHLQKTFASPLGRRALEIFQKEKPGDFQKALDFCKAIGLDPRKDIGEVVIYGDGFEKTDVTIIASLGKSTGNLEGWLLAAPGYLSEDLDANTMLHSVQTGPSRSWCALPKNPQTGNYVLIAAIEKNKAVQLARRVLTGTQSAVPNPLTGNSLCSFLAHNFSALPLDIPADQPGAGIVKSIEQIGFDVASDDDNLDLALDISASNAAKARQIGQLIQGIQAMAQLAPHDEVPKQAIDLLNSLVVKHIEGESSVRANVAMSYQLLEELINTLGIKTSTHFSDQAVPPRY